MNRTLLPATIAIAMIGFCSLQTQAGTILKLSLGDDVGFDITYDGTSLITIDDGDGGTIGDQNTAIDFLDYLSPITDIPTDTGSFTLSGLTSSGSATVIGSLVVQDFSDGLFELYDPANVLLLSANLDTSVLSGTVGSPASGAFFTTSFASVSGGSLGAQIELNSLSLSISLTDINGGVGFSLNGANGDQLTPFDADVTANVAAQQIPEPASAMLVLLGLGLVVTCSRRKI
jgi:hypothetical protein